MLTSSKHFDRKNKSTPTKILCSANAKPVVRKIKAGNWLLTAQMLQVRDKTTNCSTSDTAGHPLDGREAPSTTDFYTSAASL